MSKKSSYIPKDRQILNSMLRKAGVTTNGMSAEEVTAYFVSVKNHYFTSIAAPDTPAQEVELDVADWVFSILAIRHHKASELQVAFDRLKTIGFPNLVVRAGSTISLAVQYLAEGDVSSTKSLLMPLAREIRRKCKQDPTFKFDLSQVEKLLDRCAKASP
ncbi:MAG TPA: hypothetical protein VKU19_39825 [Bryobacteraceae bacterium]|nr:hypothetical protein [Bryobacteraceae bacterium]